jgi:hypothetical protein
MKRSKSPSLPNMIHEVIIPRDMFIDSIKEQYVSGKWETCFVGDVADWVRDNLEGTFSFNMLFARKVCFDSYRDAMMFKMFWC